MRTLEAVEGSALEIAERQEVIEQNAACIRRNVAKIVATLEASATPIRKMLLDRLSISVCLSLVLGEGLNGSNESTPSSSSACDERRLLISSQLIRHRIVSGTRSACHTLDGMSFATLLPLLHDMIRGFALLTGDQLRHGSRREETELVAALQILHEGCLRFPDFLRYYCTPATPRSHAVQPIRALIVELENAADTLAEAMQTRNSCEITDASSPSQKKTRFETLSPPTKTSTGGPYLTLAQMQACSEWIEDCVVRLGLGETTIEKTATSSDDVHQPS